jgi:hypothetical protein
MCILRVWDTQPLGTINALGIIGFLLLALVGMIVALYRSLLNGKLHTSVEWNELKSQNALLESTVRELTQQNSILIQELPAVSRFFTALHDIADTGK